MRFFALGCWLLGLVVFAAGAASPARADEAEKSSTVDDLKRIEGVWEVSELIVNGVQVEGDFLQKFSVINGPAGAWTVRHDGADIARGTSELDATMNPKTIDFTSVDSEGKQSKYIGIYELKAETRRICYVEAGRVRPGEFSSPIGSDVALITLQRVKGE